MNQQPSKNEPIMAVTAVNNLRYKQTIQCNMCHSFNAIKGSIELISARNNLQLCRLDYLQEMTI